MRPLKAVAMIIALLLGLSGCIAYTVADTAVDVTTSVVGTAVDVTTGVVGGAVDLVTDDDEDDDKEE